MKLIMFKAIFTIVRGRQAEAVEAFADANRLTLREKQIRDAPADLDRARRALAIARWHVGFGAIETVPPRRGSSDIWRSLLTRPRFALHPKRAAILRQRCVRRGLRRRNGANELAARLSPSSGKSENS